MLDGALAHYRAFEEVCAVKKARYSAPLIQLVDVELTKYLLPDPSDPSTTAASLPEDWPWWSVPEADQVKKEMMADPRWDIWARKTRE